LSIIDYSVIQSHNLSEAFKLLQKPDCYFLKNISSSQYRVVRKRIIETVLATDYSIHEKLMGKIKNLFETFSISEGKNLEKMVFPSNVTKTFNNQQQILSFLLLSSELSNSTKPAHIYQLWVDLLYLELFNQGDKEKELGLPLTSSCDREVTNPRKNETIFILYIVIPTFNTLCNIIPAVSTYYDNVLLNAEEYQEDIELVDRRASRLKSSLIFTNLS
jgi:hypothetical protein